MTHEVNNPGRYLSIYTRLDFELWNKMGMSLILGGMKRIDRKIKSGAKAACGSANDCLPGTTLKATSIFAFAQAGCGKLWICVFYLR